MTLTAIVQIGTIEYEPSQRERWVAGELALEWARRFRKVPEFINFFDADFDELAKKLAEGNLKPERRPYGFYEALAAIVLFHATGYLPMSPTHNFRFPDDSKAQIVEKLFAADVLDVIRDQTKFGATQAPDLLMYKSDLSDWFFCEVKGPRDKLGERQEPKFEAIARASGKPIRVLGFKEVRRRTV